jgi:hypothetical protein
VRSSAWGDAEEALIAAQKSKQADAATADLIIIILLLGPSLLRYLRPNSK